MQRPHKWIPTGACERRKRCCWKGPTGFVFSVMRWEVLLNMAYLYALYCPRNRKPTCARQCRLKMCC